MKENRKKNIKEAAKFIALAGSTIFCFWFALKEPVGERIESKLSQIEKLAQDETRFERKEMLSHDPISERYHIGFDREDYSFGAVIISGKLDNVYYQGIHFNDEIPEKEMIHKLQHMARVYEECVLDNRCSHGLYPGSDSYRVGPPPTASDWLLDYKDDAGKIDDINKRWLKILNRVCKDMKRAKREKE